MKWLASPFDQQDLNALRTGAAEVPGFDPGGTGLAVVSLSGVTRAVSDDAVDLVWGAKDVVAAWRP